MKTNFWIMIGALVSSTLWAQQDTNAPAPAPAAPAQAVPATPPPAAPLSLPDPAVTNTTSAAPAEAPAAPAAKKAAKKKTTKKAPRKDAKAPARRPLAPDFRTVPLVPGPAAVVASNVNVRAQAKLRSEVVTQVSKGDSVTVLEEVTLPNSGPDEPSAWAKIILPPTAKVWVNTTFIDQTNSIVIPNRLNLRSGPGENYTVLGRLEKGAAVKQLGSKGDWTQIEAPTNAAAFIAAQFLRQDQATPATPTVAEPPTVAANVPEQPAVATPTGEAPEAPAGSTNALPETPAAPTTEVAASTNAAATPAIDEAPPRRIVQREGMVRGTVSIQAPTKFALISPETGQTLDYLFTSSPELDLRRYKGLRITVTGEEYLEERWGNTPVLTIQKISVLSE